MKYTHTTIIFIFSVVAAILSVGAFFLVFNVIQNKNQHASATLATLNQKKEIKDHSTLLEKTIAEIKTSRDTIDSYFVNPTSIYSFVDNLEKLGGESGARVSVKSVEVSKTKSDTISISFLATGTFSEVMNTLEFVSNAPYKIHFTTINLNKTIDNTNSNEVPAPEKKSSLLWQVDATFNVLSSS